MTLSREDRMELVEDLLTRMVERGLLLTVQDIRDEINVSCDGTLDCPHSSSDTCNCDIDDAVGQIIELKTRIDALEDVIQTHHWIAKSTA